MCTTVILLFLAAVIPNILGYNTIIPMCCPTNWSVLKSKSNSVNGNKYECVENTTNKIIDDRFFDIRDPEFHISTDLLNHENFIKHKEYNIPNCESHELFLYSSANLARIQKKPSCLTYFSSFPIIVTCDLENIDKDHQMMKLHKCCAMGYFYDALQQNCQLQIKNNSSFDNIFDNRFLINDNAVECPSNKALVEYHLQSHMFSFDDGQLTLHNTHIKSKQIEINAFCIEKVANDSVESYSHFNSEEIFLIRTCEKAEICEKLTCIRKCCDDGEVFIKKNASSNCNKDILDNSFQNFESLIISGYFLKSSAFGILRGLKCRKYRLDPDYSEDIHIINNEGVLFLPATNQNYSRNQYCVERIFNSTWSNPKFHTFVCFDSKVVGRDKLRFKIYSIGLLISCLFYAITVLIYIFLPKLRNLPGKILLCLVSSLLVAYLGIAIGQLAPIPNNNTCFTFGILIYFSLMAAFSWMNIMCFDIWQTFGSSLNKKAFDKSHMKRFLLYSIYGWGLPTLLTATTFSLYKSSLLSENIRPQFGNGRCWFSYDTLVFPNLIFFSGPIGILFFINFALFLLTLKYCNKVKREICRMQSSNMEKPTLKRRFVLYKARLLMNLKLFVVMGITWLLELLSILFYDHKNIFLWAISDSFNVLLGVFVFLIFVCKERVWKEILGKFGKGSQNKENNPHTTFTSHHFSQNSPMMR